MVELGLNPIYDDRVNSINKLSYLLKRSPQYKISNFKFKENENLQIFLTRVIDMVSPGYRSIQENQLTNLNLKLFENPVDQIGMIILRVEIRIPIRIADSHTIIRNGF